MFKFIFSQWLIIELWHPKEKTLETQKRQESQRKQDERGQHLQVFSWNAWKKSLWWTNIWQLPRETCWQNHFNSVTSKLKLGFKIVEQSGSEKTLEKQYIWLMKYREAVLDLTTHLGFPYVIAHPHPHRCTEWTLCTRVLLQLLFQLMERHKSKLKCIFGFCLTVEAWFSCNTVFSCHRQANGKGTGFINED